MSEKRYYVRDASCNYESCSRIVFIRYFQLNEHFNRLEIHIEDVPKAFNVGYCETYVCGGVDCE